MTAKREKLFDVLVHVLAFVALLGFIVFIVYLVLQRSRSRGRGIQAGEGLIIYYNFDNPDIVNGFAYEKGVLDIPAFALTVFS